MRGAKLARGSPVVARAAPVTLGVSASADDERLRLHNLSPLPGSRQKKKRIGRGYGAGQGGSCGAGMRGQKAGAAKAVALVLPQLKGKLNGIALRVPTPNVSVVDLVIQTSKKVTADEVNAAFREAANGKLKGILAVADEPLVSCDFRCSDVSTTIDAALTMVMGDDMLKVVAWYDNEWGYSQRVVDLAELVAANFEEGPTRNN